MNEFKKGQRVHVEFDAEIVSVGNTCLVVHHGGHNSWVSPSTTKVTLANPVDWPPQVGDIWEAEGQEYYAEEWKRDSLTVQPFSHRDSNFAYSDREEYAKSLNDFKALSPTLVRRRKA